MNDFLKGASRVIGVVAGFFPIAVSFGAVSVQAGIPAIATIGMSMGVYAGASQFAAAEAVRQGLPWFSIVLTMLIINLRHIPMSLAAAQKIYNRFPWGKRWLLAHGLIDETFALNMLDEPRSFLYYLGMNVSCWSAWVLGTCLGAVVGLQIPERWLQFALPAMFLYLLTDNVRRLWGREVVVVIGIGVALALVTQSFGSTGILIAILGVAIAATLLLNPPSSASISDAKEGSS
ncbi:AzlC family ABC transporter permease [Oscillatoria sp. FACHB-1407]|uniref:AzlC family ABC transporter permease n=1 Tax=Oscillatoria sp. FACHB-1407 TaxID=2692847 RepID=UPI0016842858|nr:AzlC family ABC transporter permease [Oscillatoria sp. FACHB-1407]MBD2462930.1 AzlC family ABC transporter permease [Oscillatoria sp. FACHB-1407]